MNKITTEWFSVKEFLPYSSDEIIVEYEIEYLEFPGIFHKHISTAIYLKDKNRFLIKNSFNEFYRVDGIQHTKKDKIVRIIHWANYFFKVE